MRKIRVITLIVLGVLLRSGACLYSAQLPVPGDINGDGGIGTADSSAVLYYLLHGQPPDYTAFDRQAADYTGDGIIDYNDVYSILASDAGLEDHPAQTGDINADGFVDSRDLSLLNRIVRYKGFYTGLQKARADCNADGRVDTNDFWLLQVYLRGEVNWPVKADVFKIMTFDGEGHTSRFNDQPALSREDIVWYYTEAVEANLEDISGADVVVFPEFAFYDPAAPVCFRAKNNGQPAEAVVITSQNYVSLMLKRLRALAVRKTVNFVIGTVQAQEASGGPSAYNGPAAVIINSNGSVSIKNVANSVTYDFYNKHGYHIAACVYICSEAASARLPENRADLIIHTSHFEERLNHPILSDELLLGILSGATLAGDIKTLPTDLMKQCLSFGFGTGFNKMQAVQSGRGDILVQTPNPNYPDPFRITGLLGEGIVSPFRGYSSGDERGRVVLLSSDQFFADLCVMRVDKAPLERIGYSHNGALWENSNRPGYAYAEVMFSRE